MQSTVGCPQCSYPIDSDAFANCIVYCPACGTALILADPVPAETVSTPASEVFYEDEAYEDGAYEDGACEDADAENEEWELTDPDSELADRPAADHLLPSQGVTEVWNTIAMRPRNRRPETSFVRKLIPPVLGGLAAIPISLAILWYGFGRDLGNAGPTIAKYVPWIVPPALRGGYASRRGQLPKTPSQRSEMETPNFGSLGSRSGGASVGQNRSASNPSPTFTKDSKPTSRRPKPSDPLKDWAMHWISLHDEWELQPTEPESALQATIYRNLCRWADTHTLEMGFEEQATAGLSPEVESLLQQTWFVEAISRGASGDLVDVPAPTVGDRVVWIAESIELDPRIAWSDTPANPHPLFVAPSLVIQSVRTRMLADASLRPRRSELFRGLQRGPYLLIGSFDRQDEYGYEVRIERILP